MNEIIRVLQVITIMNRGGLESRLMDIYRNIDKEKIQFDFLTHRKERGSFDDEIESLGGIIYRGYQIHPKNLMKYIRFLRNFFAEHAEYNIVHAHINELSGFVLYEAKRAGVKTRIAHSRNSSSSGAFAKRAFKYFSRYFVRPNCTHAFAVSKEAGDWIFGGKKYRVIPNAIQAQTFRFNPDTRNIMRKKMNLEGSTVIGHVGRFHLQKNHDFLLEIFKSILEKEPAAKLLLIGDGALRQHIESKISSLGLNDSVLLLGIHKEVSPFYQAMDILVMPSLFEGLPGVGIEAQASGLPCVFSDIITKEVNIVADLVTYLSLDRSAEEWANIILKKAKITRRDTYNEIVEAGFDISKISDWYKDFYIECQSS